MEFLVEFEVNVPDGAPATEVEARTSAEASAAASLVDRGHLVRLWKLPAAPSETKALGLYRADNEPQLARHLAPLPLTDRMQITVTPHEPQTNDPAPPRRPTPAASGQP